MTTEKLQKQLKGFQLKQEKPGECVKIMLMQSPIPLDIFQIGKLIMSPEVRGGNICGDSNNSNSDENNFYPPEPFSCLPVTPMTKTEEILGPRGGVGNCSGKTTTFDPNQMDDLQDRYGRKPEKTETEYLWTVSLTGGDRILLNGDETSGYWGPGVFLNTGLKLLNGPNSLTSRVAY